MGLYLLLYYVKNSYKFAKFVIELPLIAVKTQIGGNANTFMSIFFPVFLGFAVGI